MSPNLVFAAGVLVPQRILGHDYFKGLAALYPAETTLFARVSPLGSEGVNYFCYAGKSVESAELHPLHFYIKNLEGENDGVVSVASATWPERLSEEAWDADHISEIGYNLNRPDLISSFSHVDAIARIVKRATS